MMMLMLLRFSEFSGLLGSAAMARLWSAAAWLSAGLTPFKVTLSILIECDEDEGDRDQEWREHEWIIRVFYWVWGRAYKRITKKDEWMRYNFRYQRERLRLWSLGLQGQFKWKNKVLIESSFPSSSFWLLIWQELATPQSSSFILPIIIRFTN